MVFLVVVVLIDSLVVMSTGAVLNHRAKKTGEDVAEAFRRALEEQGPKIVAEAFGVNKEEAQ